MKFIEHMLTSINISIQFIYVFTTKFSLHAKVRPYTTFHLGGQLYQFTRMSGVADRSTCLQRKIDEFLKKHDLHNIYALVDNVRILGTTKKSMI